MSTGDLTLSILVLLMKKKLKELCKNDILTLVLKYKHVDFFPLFPL